MASPAINSAAAFRDLHREGILILANVWDAGTARLVESLGVRALATTSAAVAWSLGYPDGDRLPIALVVDVVARIRRVTTLPLSVDLEGGYSDEPALVADHVARVLAAGAVGLNLEDGNRSPENFCAKLEAIRARGRQSGDDVFINARIDAYLRNQVPAADRLDETLRRARLYRAAGADGIFVPGLTDLAAMHRIAQEIPLPLNILARPGLPDAAALAAAGVRRLSAGSGLPEVMFGRTAALAADFLRTGRSDPLSEGAMSYRDVNALLARAPGNEPR